MKKRLAIFIIDSLSASIFDEFKDLFPKPFDFYSKFYCTPSTFLSSSSILLGCHVLACSEEPFRSPFAHPFVFTKKAPLWSEDCLLQLLKDKGIPISFTSTEPIFEKLWWKDHCEKRSAIIPEGFSLFHNFNTHLPHGRYRSAELYERQERQEAFQIYKDKTRNELKKTAEELEKNEGLKAIVLGDHGEEFWLNHLERLPIGHGDKLEPFLATENTLYTGLLIYPGLGKLDKTSVVSYAFLKRIIKDFFDARS